MLDSAFVLIWMRNSRSTRDVLRLVAERRPGQQRVGEQRRDLEAGARARAAPGLTVRSLPAASRTPGMIVTIAK